MIRNRKHMEQIKDFRGLEFIRGIGPTDIDGFFEIDGRVFVFFELKYKNAKMGTGQEKGFERLCDVLCENGRHSIFIIAKHDTEDGDIQVSRCEVVRYRVDGKWWHHRGNQTLKEFIDSYLIANGF